MKQIQKELFSLIYFLCLSFGLSSSELQDSMKKRYAGGEAEPSPLGCLDMVSSGGEFDFTSTGSDDVCGLYIIGLIGEKIEIDVTDFSVSCDKDGLVSVVDGWELRGEFFPGEEDHQRSMDERYRTYCGKNAPSKIFLSSQNVAMMQFRVPSKGQGFKIRIKFHTDPEPCNAVSMAEEGTVTMTNYGRNKNCTLSIINPEKLELISIDVGETPEGFEARLFETGTIYKCQKRNRKDYLELLTGSGFDPALMWRNTDMCGRNINPKPASWCLGCQHSVIRLVSSGKYYNSVTLRYQPLTAEDMDTMDKSIC